jgi:hypothetical protein
MYPFSYIGIKIVHDQQVQEALEHHRFDTDQATYRHYLFQTFEKCLARFTNRPGRKQEGPVLEFFLADPNPEPDPSTMRNQSDDSAGDMSCGAERVHTLSWGESSIHRRTSSP